MTLHQMNGAVLLATRAALAVWTWRLLKAVEGPGGGDCGAGVRASGGGDGFAKGFDALDEAEGDHVVIADERGVAGEGMDNQHGVLAEPSRAGLGDVDGLAAGEVETGAGTAGRGSSSCLRSSLVMPKW